MPKRCFTVFLLILFSLLTGCTSEIWDRGPPPNAHVTGTAVGVASGAVIGSFAGGAGAGVGAIVGGFWGGAMGEIIDRHRTVVEDLIYNGVQVVQIGDEVLLILPADRFFYKNSPNLNPNYLPTLNKIASFLCCLEKMDIKVAGYTDDSCPWERNLVLSKLQARTIMNYLWSAGVDARLMYAVGYGEQWPIASNDRESGRAKNRRIEITLRKLVPPILI